MNGTAEAKSDAEIRCLYMSSLNGCGHHPSFGERGASTE
jgi:hypothetical protein